MASAPARASLPERSIEAHMKVPWRNQARARSRWLRSSDPSKRFVRAHDLHLFVRFLFRSTDLLYCVPPLDVPHILSIASDKPSRSTTLVHLFTLQKITDQQGSLLDQPRWGTDVLFGAVVDPGRDRQLTMN